MKLPAAAFGRRSTELGRFAPREMVRSTMAFQDSVSFWEPTKLTLLDPFSRKQGGTKGPEGGRENLILLN